MGAITSVPSQEPTAKIEQAEAAEVFEKPAPFVVEKVVSNEKNLGK